MHAGVACMLFSIPMSARPISDSHVISSPAPSLEQIFSIHFADSRATAEGPGCVASHDGVFREHLYSEMRPRRLPFSCLRRRTPEGRKKIVSDRLELRRSRADSRQPQAVIPHVWFAQLQKKCGSFKSPGS
ncbi:hypothetical protein EJ02DRAFT_262667 [Clathrospora elynae]|uniref:Uncharacterized protein n=1 Tax=Clathrospora elynae TaxID=706981 RepID=A0A6A5T1N2_9PLEO|nr:hypothetical protein EJ02DRAFT_262667 [Clathrospora elynae]